MEYKKNNNHNSWHSIFCNNYNDNESKLIAISNHRHATLMGCITLSEHAYLHGNGKGKRKNEILISWNDRIFIFA